MDEKEKQEWVDRLIKEINDAKERWSDWYFYQNFYYKKYKSFTSEDVMLVCEMMEEDEDITEDIIREIEDELKKFNKKVKDDIRKVIELGDTAIKKIKNGEYDAARECLCSAVSKENNEYKTPYWYYPLKSLEDFIEIRKLYD